jgi:hypothetical protein
MINCVGARRFWAIGFAKIVFIRHSAVKGDYRYAAVLECRGEFHKGVWK